MSHTPPHGLGMSPNIVDRIRKEERERMFENPFREAEENPIPSPGGDRRSEEAKGNQGANGTLKRGSNQASYLARRLARDHEEIFGQLKAGEYSSVRLPLLSPKAPSKRFRLRPGTFCVYLPENGCNRQSGWAVMSKRFSRFGG